MHILFLDTERQPEINEFEQPELAGPENVGGLEVAMDDALLVEVKERLQQILGKPENSPGRQASPPVLVDYLARK